VGDEVGARIETASGGLPACLAQGTGAEVWFIQTHPFGLGCIDTETMKIVHHHPEGRAAEVQEPHAAAFGPDGNLWFTDRKGCQIGRITPRERDGAPPWEVSLFDLGKGQHPEEIICSKDAWLFFTVKDQAVIGSIRAVDARAEEGCGAFVPRRPREAVELPEAGAGGPAVAKAAAGEAARPRRKLSGAQRRKRRQQSERVAKEPLTESPTEDREGASEDGQAAAPAPEAPAGETKGCPAAPPRSASLAGKHSGRAVRTPDPRKRLEAMYVQVDDERIEHILKRHGAETKEKASTFAPEYSTWKGLLGLLANQLDGAEIGRELRVDRKRNFYTTCMQPRVGWCNNQETGIFTVVTCMVWNKGTREWWHKVVTVYPGE
jgi:hypothetical protein